jgi:hypothetical protein
MSKIAHDDAIEFPNGEGFTPCSREYAQVCDELEALKPDYINLDELSPEDYELWNKLDDMRASLMLAGHLGKSIRY